MIENNNMKIIKPFYTPLYTFKYDKHEEYKEKVLNFLDDEELYKKNTRRPSLKFTHPNLHKEEAIKDFTDFFKRCIAFAMDDYGYIPEFCMTGLWATKHDPNIGFHHMHSHHNSFFGGVYYLDGGENTGGTVFYAPHRYSQQITPARNGKSLRMRHSQNIPFEEGKLVIFPAWATHDTAINRSNKPRTILSFNVMPLGKTNTDPFDRYNYQSVDNVEMVNYLEDLDG